MKSDLRNLQLVGPVGCDAGLILICHDVGSAGSQADSRRGLRRHTLRLLDMEESFLKRPQIAILEQLGSHSSRIGGRAMGTNEEYESLQRYAMLGPIVRKASDQYFANMFEIQELWRVLVKERFSSLEHRNRLWGLCQEGMGLAGEWLNAEHTVDPDLVPRDFPCYTRAIMLLEKERRFDEAIVLCDQALHWSPNSEWYVKKESGLLTEVSSAMRSNTCGAIVKAPHAPARR